MSHEHLEYKALDHLFHSIQYFHGRYLDKAATWHAWKGLDNNKPQIKVTTKAKIGFTVANKPMSARGIGQSLEDFCDNCVHDNGIHVHDRTEPDKRQTRGQHAATSIIY